MPCMLVLYVRSCRSLSVLVRILILHLYVDLSMVVSLLIFFVVYYNTMINISQNKKKIPFLHVFWMDMVLALVFLSLTTI